MHLNHWMLLFRDVVGGGGSGMVGEEAEDTVAGLLPGVAVGGVAATKNGSLGFLLGSTDSSSLPLAISLEAKCWVFLNAC